MWRHSLKNWENVDKDVYKFCFEQAEKRLKDVLDDSEKITSRTYALIGILIPVLSVCVGIVLKSLVLKSGMGFLGTISIISILILGGCLFFLASIIKERDVWFSGTEPQDILLSHYVEVDTLENDEPVKYMYLSEMEQIQHKIESNKTVNEQRIGIFSKCLIVVVITTIAALASILSLSIF